MCDAASFFAGLAFFENATVLPVLLAKLHASDTIIGLARFVQVVGFAFPALFASHYVHGRANHKAFLLWVCAIGRAGLLALPPLFYFVAVPHPRLALIVFFVIYSVFWFLDGASVVSWFDIIGKTIPERVRGRFFGTMQVLNGLVAIGAGLIVNAVLKQVDFRNDFTLLASLWCVGVLGSQICLSLIREPEGTAVEEEDKPAFTTYLRQAWPLVQRNHRLGHLIITRFLLDGAGMALPFYILFADRDLGQGTRMVGIYAVLQSVGKVCTGPVWGWLSDHAGPRRGLQAVALCIVLIPAFALLSAHGTPAGMFGVFFLLGAVQDGLWMVGSTLLLESVSDQDRPLAVGVTSLFQTPSALYAVIGGLLAQMTSYQTVFVGALMFAVSGVIMAMRLPANTKTLPWDSGPNA